MSHEDQRSILDAKASVPSHVVYRWFEKETLLLNLETGQYHGLNPTGGRLLQLLEETDGNLREAVTRVAGECEVPPEDIVDDMASFCAELSERGLIELDVEPRPPSR